jgi:hypothetical protein
MRVTKGGMVGHSSRRSAANVSRAAKGGKHSAPDEAIECACCSR